MQVFYAIILSCGKSLFLRELVSPTLHSAFIHYIFSCELKFRQNSIYKSLILNRSQCNDQKMNTFYAFSTEHKQKEISVYQRKVSCLFFALLSPYPEIADIWAHGQQILR